MTSVARRDDAAHEAHGNALAEQVPVELSAHLEVLALWHQHAGLAEDIEDAEHHRNALGNDSGHGRSLDPHADDGDEHEVQRHIQARGDQQKDQRHETVADGPEQACTEVVRKHDQHAHVNDEDIAVGLFQDLRRGVQQHQQRVQAHKACQRDAEGGQKSDDERARHGLLEQVLVLGPVGARCNDGKAVANTNAESDQKLVDRAAGANGGQCRVAQHIAHDHGVHGIIQLLEQVGNKNGEHEDEQALENGAVHQVHILVEEIFLCGDGLGHRVPASQN